MTSPSLHFVDCPGALSRQGGPRRMACWQWGQADSAQVVLCVHGLTRQGRDFDELAKSLLARASAQGQSLRVICPDVAGRGHSDWLADPMAYAVGTYAADMLALLAQLHSQAAIEQLDWVGTSMGGLIGMLVCGQAGLPLPVPVRRLVLNDVGPTLDWVALQRIAGNLEQVREFANVDAAAQALRQMAAGFGPHSTQQWLALCRPLLRPLQGELLSDDTPCKLHYDPVIAVPVREVTEESTQRSNTVLWAWYDHISAQTLLVRGADSDLLSHATAVAMTERGPRAQLVEFASVGHAPTLIAPDQQAAVLDFLLGA